MIAALSNRLLSFLIKNELVNKNDTFDVDYYRYGLEILISSILNILIILLLSLLTNNVLCGLFFLLVFIPTRQYTGGFHADTYLNCNLIFGLSYLITYYLCCYTWAFAPFEVYCVTLLLEILMITRCCPIENKNKPISDFKQKRRCKVLATLLFGLYGIIGLILIYFDVQLGAMFLYTLHLIVVLGILGIIKERRRVNEKAK